MLKKLLIAAGACLAIASPAFAADSAIPTPTTTPPPPALRGVLEQGGFTYKFAAQGKYGLCYFATRHGGWLRAAVPFAERSNAARTAKLINTNREFRARFVSVLLPGQLAKYVRLVGRVRAFQGYIVMTLKVP